MKKAFIISFIINILLLILLIYILNINYSITYCNNNKCITTKQKIFDYIIGKE